MVISPVINIIISVCLGYLAGLGVGGGSLLMLWMTAILKTNYAEARIINLLFFLAAAGSISLFRWKQGVLHVKTLLPAMIGGCAASAAVTILSFRIDTHLLSKGFGILLILTGMREIFYRPRKAK